MAEGAVRGDKFPIWETVIASWRDGFRVLIVMPQLPVVASVGLLSTTALNYLVEPVVAGNELLRVLSGFMVAVLDAALVAPYAIAVHRYVLLREVTARYVFDPASGRLRTFILFAFAADLLFMLPSFSRANLAVFVWGNLALFCLAGLLWVRLALVFPAIAVDATNLVGPLLQREVGFLRTLSAVMLLGSPPIFAVFLCVLSWNANFRQKYP